MSAAQCLLGASIVVSFIRQRFLLPPHVGCVDASCKRTMGSKEAAAAVDRLGRVPIVSTCMTFRVLMMCRLFARL